MLWRNNCLLPGTAYSLPSAQPSVTQVALNHQVHTASWIPLGVLPWPLSSPNKNAIRNEWHLNGGLKIRQQINNNKKRLTEIGWYFPYLPYFPFPLLWQRGDRRHLYAVYWILVCCCANQKKAFDWDPTCGSCLQGRCGSTRPSTWFQ